MLILTFQSVYALHGHDMVTKTELKLENYVHIIVSSLSSRVPKSFRYTNVNLMLVHKAKLYVILSYGEPLSLPVPSVKYA